MPGRPSSGEQDCGKESAALGKLSGSWGPSGRLSSLPPWNAPLSMPPASSPSPAGTPPLQLHHGGLLPQPHADSAAATVSSSCAASRMSPPRYRPSLRHPEAQLLPHHHPLRQLPHLLQNAVSPQMPRPLHPQQRQQQEQQQQQLLQMLHPQHLHQQSQLQHLQPQHTQETRENGTAEQRAFLQVCLTCPADGSGETTFLKFLQEVCE